MTDLHTAVYHVAHTATNGNTPPAPADKEMPQLLRRWSAAELDAEDDHFDWLITGLLAQPTYGTLAGAEKSLKTYLATMVAVGLAGGVPILDRFKPPQARPVVVYVGEGGRIPYTRRLRRICAATGTQLADLPLYVIPEAAPILSETFQASLQRDLDTIQPGLVIVDPLYAYHGVSTSAASLHEEGALLTGLSDRCTNSNASLLIVNHLNQTGTAKLGLRRITMAGGAEWSDTWLLVEHRQDPDVAAGAFKLSMQIGSRQWGGSTWNLDLNIGAFDTDLGHHEGQIEWDLTPANGTGNTKPDKDADTRLAITTALADRPWQHTKTDLREIVAGNRDRFDRVLNTMARDGTIAHDKRARTEMGVARSRLVWALTGTKTDQNGGNPARNNNQKGPG